MANPMMGTITSTFTWLIVAVVVIGAIKIAAEIAIKNAKKKRRVENQLEYEENLSKERRRRKSAKGVCPTCGK